MASFLQQFSSNCKSYWLGSSRENKLEIIIYLLPQTAGEDQMMEDDQGSECNEVLREGLPKQSDLVSYDFAFERNLDNFFSEECEQNRPTLPEDNKQVLVKEGVFYEEECLQKEDVNLNVEQESLEAFSAFPSNSCSESEMSSPVSETPPQRKKAPAKPKPKKRRKGRKGIRKAKNSQTKNIPKNYGKQIIKFSLQNLSLLQERNILGNSTEAEMADFVSYLKLRKRSMNKISDLRSLWTEEPYGQALRIISLHFLRTRCYEWIYNSRVEDRGNPLKYRPRILQGVHNPQEFMYLKEY